MWEYEYANLQARVSRAHPEAMLDCPTSKLRTPHMSFPGYPGALSQ